jgi:hypothetical protein
MKEARENCIMMMSVVLTLRQTSGRSNLRTYTGDEKCIQSFSRETLMKETSCDFKIYFEVDIKLDVS